MDATGLVFEHTSERIELSADWRRCLQNIMINTSNLPAWYLEFRNHFLEKFEDRWDKMYERADPASRMQLFPLHIRLLATHLHFTIIVITLNRHDPTEEEVIKIYHPDPNHRQLSTDLHPSTTSEYTHAGDYYSWDSFLSFWLEQSVSFRDLCLILAYDRTKNHYYGTTRMD